MIGDQLRVNDLLRWQAPDPLERTGATEASWEKIVMPVWRQNRQLRPLEWDDGMLWGW